MSRDPRIAEAAAKAAEYYKNRQHGMSAFCAKAAIRAYLEAVRPEMAMVPVEPTEQMLRAGFAAMNETPSSQWKRMKAEGVTPRRMFDVKMAPRWRAMIDAALSERRE
jgi:hypothetical protein